MTARIVASTCFFIGVVFMSVSVARVDPISQPHPKAFLADAQTTPAAPYAYMKLVKLGDLVPTETDAPDFYMRLIAIEGEVLLPVDHVR